MKEHVDWMASLLYPERPDRTIEHVQNRALGLYYACMSRDTYFAKLKNAIISETVKNEEGS